MDLSRRLDEIDQILSFVGDHRESYASLAVCRRALDQGLASVTEPVLSELEHHLEQAPDDEVEAYYYIIS